MWRNKRGRLRESGKSALLQAVLWEEGAHFEAWLTLAPSPDPEEGHWKQIPLEEAGGKLHHPAVPALLSRKWLLKFTWSLLPCLGWVSRVLPAAPAP